MLPPRLAHLVSENSSAVLELFDDSNATRAPGCSKIGHQYSATLTAAKPQIPADGPRRDRSYRLVSACPQSIKWSGGRKAKLPIGRFTNRHATKRRVGISSGATAQPFVVIDR